MSRAAEPELGTLWIVATPIGSLGDLSPRAREVLGAVDLILAEDTRRTRALLAHAGIPAGRRLASLRQENEAAVVQRLLDRLAAGAGLALVSDGGMPVLSDPGFLLVRAARGRGLRVCSVPGPSAFTAALAAAGQPPLPSLLAGFLPPRRAARLKRVAELATFPWTVVVLLSPHRLRGELADLADGLGRERPATLLVELSKLHERAVVGTLDVLQCCPEVGAPRGEYVLVVGPRSTVKESGVAASPARLREDYERAVAMGCDRRAALRQAARGNGLSRREAYRALLEEPGRPRASGL